jgi:hypothetical protein
MMFDGMHWIHIDPKDPAFRKQFAGDVRDDADAGGAAAVLSTVRSATRQGNQITGTLDLTGSVSTSLPWSMADIKSAGEPATAVPFEANLSVEGLVNRLELRLPALGREKQSTWTLALYQYGLVSPPAAPERSLVVEM